jgi:drug/metabolite transporter (DMT)-like permease
MWATPKLNPAVVGLLIMTEISVGAVTAALWAGEPFGVREASGVVLITAAGVLESAWQLWAKPRPRRA